MLTTSTTNLKEALHISRDASLFFCIGVELEFYAKNYEKEQILQYITAYCQEHNYTVPTLLEAEGEGQFELVFVPSKDLLSYAEMIHNIRHQLQEYAKEVGRDIDFSAKPDKGQPGSAMHVHVNVYDRNGENIYAKDKQDAESVYLLWSMAALLEDILSSMLWFAPQETDYLRYQYPDRNTPSTVSWGGDNRTVALRIPPVGENTQQQRRIEHRVPSPKADTYETFAAIVVSICRGLKRREQPAIIKTYGNAWDLQYGLKPLPVSLQEAVQYKGEVV